MEQLDLLAWRPRKRRKLRQYPATEWKIVAVRETAPNELTKCECAENAADYWRKQVATGLLYNPEIECFAVLLLNTKRRIRGHHLVSVGLLDQTVVHPREVFRAAIIGAAHSVILMHNHPSGDCTPSPADLRLTRELVQAASILRIAVLDHIIVGHQCYCSFREAGHL